ncbi:MAG: cytochrome c biogenesis protein DipZ [Patescibacteria group bacterium]|nr:cytochrome c biogenesis protein DipZ [Patescibacteria group bacterium]MCL5431614.1 cytochrome c biogenesis protein DipZ [Patescibacteria group bacterium]
MEPQRGRGRGLRGGLVTGLSLGLVWSPCAGPILASVAALSATGQLSVQVGLVTLAYVLGVGVPLFLFAAVGQQVFGRLHFLSTHLGQIQKIFGVILILTALAIYTNFDVYLQTKAADIFGPVNSFESNPAVQKQLDILQGRNQASADQAPDFVGGTNWLNLPAGRQALTLADLKGKVVLVDFWTYTCINCIRTLPHVTAWYDKYHDQGLVVIGVHTPEFAFEHDTSNVAAAIKQYNIHYPVIQDNNYAIWNAYNNQYWPAEYLLNQQGQIVHTHFGEGEYDQTEELIQQLLKVKEGLSSMPDQTPQGVISPETYLGSDRAAPTSDLYQLSGQWQQTAQYITAGANAALDYNFFASKVYLVLAPSAMGPGTVTVFLDGQKINTVTVDSDRLYTLVDLPGAPAQHQLHLEFSFGVQAFAFTFG